MLNCVSGRWWRRGGGAALGGSRARAPASPALTTLSWPRPPSWLGPVPRPRPVRPWCPFGRLKPVGQAAGGKLARLRQRRLCEGRGKRGAVQSGVCVGEGVHLDELTALGVPSVCRAICLGGQYGRTSGLEAQLLGAPLVLGVNARTPKFGVPLDLSLGRRGP